MNIRLSKHIEQHLTRKKRGKSSSPLRGEQTQGCETVPHGSGMSFPLGATVCTGGVNFSVYSKNSKSIELLLFERADDPKPFRVIPLDPRKNRTYYYWHIFIPDLKPGQIYGYRAHGPFEPRQGHYFDSDKVLLDPYGKAVVVPKNYSRLAASEHGDNTATAMKSVVADLRDYDWEGDTQLRRPFVKTFIYEMHVKGFTRHPSSGISENKRGTYAGLIEKIPYFKDLGVTAIELLPVFQFDEQDCPHGLINYWGYSPVSFFAPHSGYSSRDDHLGPINEFRDMVKALHKAGIEVILDVVYNHTAEGNHRGPVISLKGLENSAYYILDADMSYYSDYSGTGNTLNANHPIVRRMIVDSLHYWVEEMHVDGFRFDLASILTRDEAGKPLANPPIIWDIETDPVLAGIKLIAEAWDAAGLYQVGAFIGDRWKEWNGRFRDDVRGFLRGDNDMVSKIAPRFFASPDIYGHKEREPEQSINFVTCHDGFTLNDLVSYNYKHNEANGEGNRDGTDDNRSWNCGIEGPTSDADVERLRTRQIKNFMAITILALGTPMLLMGDEVRRTQYGNNNAFCQDNEISWLDWRLFDTHKDIYRFVKTLISLRLSSKRPVEADDMSLNQILRQAKIQWHGVKLNQPDWSHDSHSISFTAQDLRGSYLYHLIINAHWEALSFELPPVPAGSEDCWQRIIDTYLEPPEDICSPLNAPVIEGGIYVAQPRSVVLLYVSTNKREHSEKA